MKTNAILEKSKKMATDMVHQGLRTIVDSMLSNEENAARQTKERGSDFIKRIQTSDTKDLSSKDLSRLANIVAMEYVGKLYGEVCKPKFRNVDIDALYQEFKDSENYQILKSFIKDSLRISWLGF